MGIDTLIAARNTGISGIPNTQWQSQNAQKNSTEGQLIEKLALTLFLFNTEIGSPFLYKERSHMNNKYCRKE